MKECNLYIAGSFADPKDRKELEKLVQIIRNRLSNVKDTKIDIYVPMEHKIEEDFQKPDGTWNLPNHIWASKVFDMDVEALNRSDMVIAMYTGTGGTSWELGYSYAKNIPTYIYIPEYAKSKDMSLMVLNSINGYLDDFENLIFNNRKEDLLKQLNQK